MENLPYFILTLIEYCFNQAIIISPPSAPSISMSIFPSCIIVVELVLLVELELVVEVLLDVDVVVPV